MCKNLMQKITYLLNNTLSNILLLNTQHGVTLNSSLKVYSCMISIKEFLFKVYLFYLIFFEYFFI